MKTAARHKPHIRARSVVAVSWFMSSSTRVLLSREIVKVKKKSFSLIRMRRSIAIKHRWCFPFCSRWLSRHWKYLAKKVLLFENSQTHLNNSKTRFLFTRLKILHAHSQCSSRDESETNNGQVDLLLVWIRTKLVSTFFKKRKNKKLNEITSSNLIFISKYLISFPFSIKVENKSAIG